MNFTAAVPQPEDGFDAMEKMFLRKLVIDMYKKIKDPEDKFILIAVKEMGYSERDVGEMINKNQSAISNHIKKIREELKLSGICEGYI